MYYRIHRPLNRFRGAVTGKRYTSTSNAMIEAPEGEFDRLKPGAFIILNDDGSPAEGDGEPEYAP